MDPKTPICLVRSTEHMLLGHPENPARFDGFSPLLSGALSSQLYKIKSGLNEEEVLSSVLLVHDPTYVKTIQDSAEKAPIFLDHGDTYATPHSYSCAIAAVSGTLAVVDAILEGRTKRGFALVRPPGHHANQHKAMGFCLFNNIAIAARTLQNNGYAKIAIFDFDVHHGNGTQDIFESDPDVLFISTHQQGIYPGTGHKQDVGRGAGEGTIVNIPLPAYTGIYGFESSMEDIVLPALERFKPEFLLISAGFDAHWSDPLANLQLSTTGYYRMARSLIGAAEGLCGGRIAFALEGGYDPQALADNVSAVLHAQSGLPEPEDRLGSAPIAEPDISALIKDIQAIHHL